MSKQEVAWTPVTDEIDREYGVPVIELTDEELQAVNPLSPSARLVIFPFFDQLEEAERDLATVVAFRGLAARGLVSPADQEQVDAATAGGGERVSVEIEMDERISGILQTRLAAPAVVCAQRRVGERADYCYWYLVDEEAALEEFVETMGLHRFRAMECRLVPMALYGYLNPQRVSGRDGDTIRDAAAGQTPAAELEELAGVHTVGEFIVRNGPRPPGHPLMVGVATGPGGLHLTEVRFGSGEPVRIREVSAATLYGAVERAVAVGSGSEVS